MKYAKIVYGNQLNDFNFNKYILLSVETLRVLCNIATTLVNNFISIATINLICLI